MYKTENISRQIVLDTETTGLDTAQGHRVIEIGCIELINRRITGNVWHEYINPERMIEKAAEEVHGITNEFLKDKKKFIDLSESLMNFLEGSELIIHNAPFDMGFLQNELKISKKNIKLDKQFKVVDTLLLARELHPGQRNSLDALCKRYEIDNSSRDKHGALLDAELLARVYLAMTGGQVSLTLGFDSGVLVDNITQQDIHSIPVITADIEEIQAHETYLKLLQEKTNGHCVWLIE